MLSRVKEQTQILAETIVHLAQDTNQIGGDINKVKREIAKCLQSIEEVSEISKAHTTAISSLQRDTQILYSRTDVLEEDQRSLQTKLAAHDVDIQEIQQSTKSLDEGQTCLKSRITDVEDTVTTLSEDMEALKLYHGNTRHNAYFFRAPNRLTTFVGRTDELLQLQNGFRDAASEGHTMTICGLGGIGKTSLAIEYAWLLQEFYPGGVFWLSAEDDQAMENSIRQIAIDLSTVGKDNRETAQKTLNCIASFTERWLLVVDNLDEDELSRETKNVIIGNWRRNSRGHVLLTSRREGVELTDILRIKQEECITLKSLGMEESILFMTKRTGQPEDENLHLLVKELAGLPLAMEQAAAYMKVSGLTFADYTKKFMEKRLQFLNREKVHHSVVDIHCDRLTVLTTWSINFEMVKSQSQEKGMGDTAALVMQISSYFSADDIPMELFNCGEPLVEQEDMQLSLRDAIDSKEIVYILTKFSLFQRNGVDTVHVHRIVQEVIRDRVREKSDEVLILRCAVRMLNFAIQQSVSPYDVLCRGPEAPRDRGALRLWSKIADNACSVNKHISKLLFASSNSKEFLNLETIRVLHESSVYHSIQQRQDVAFSTQDQMLQMMMTCTISESEIQRLTAIKVPLMTAERKIIQSCIATTFTLKDTVNYLADKDTLREEGNKAFQCGKYQMAIQMYTEAIRASPEDTTDDRLFSNRSLCYRQLGEHMKSLQDANQSIQMNPNNWKSHAWRSYAIAKLVESECLPEAMFPSGLASASIASYMNERFYLDHQTKLYYPILLFEVIKSPTELLNAIQNISDRTLTTLLLPKGEYKLDCIFLPKSVQIVGIEDSVNLHFNQETGIYLQRFPGDVYGGPLKFETDEELSIHFENLTFAENGGQVRISTGITASLYRCTVSNGKKGCRDFPRCNGGTGCVNAGACSKQQTLFKTFVSCKQSLGESSSGEGGFPGIVAESGGKVYIEQCVIERCGGGGPLSDGKGSRMEVKHCIIRNLIQMGLEVRNDGTLVAEDNVIHDNHTHGVAIGPNGNCSLLNNQIYGNGREGILCSPTSTARIVDNTIHHNNLSGISLDEGSYEISSNQIFENWCWGVFLKSRASCFFLNNEIFENKCGGIRIGHNYSAQVYLDGNTIRDHSGPGLLMIPSIAKFQHGLKKDMDKAEQLAGKPQDEPCIYTTPPLQTNRNIFKNNDRKDRHPTKLSESIAICSQCHKPSSHLKKCGRCKKASYCCKGCQTEAWKRHKDVCKVIVNSYSVAIEMSRVQTRNAALGAGRGAGRGVVRMVSSGLVGPDKCQKPDRMNSKRFIVKIQSGAEYHAYNPNQELMLYDQSSDLDIVFGNPSLYHLVIECGHLGANDLTTKKIYCWAAFEQKGNVLRIFTDTLAPYQIW